MRPHQSTSLYQKQKVTENTPLYTPCKFELLKKHNSSIIALCVSQIYSVSCGTQTTIPCPVLLAQCRVVHRKPFLISTEIYFTIFRQN